MWMKLLVSMITSSTAKTLICVLIDKLLTSRTDGITEDVATVMLEGIAKSKSNRVTVSSLAPAKNLL